jgi:3',5'-cyclic-AMP phosphodiesterase
VTVVVAQLSDLHLRTDGDDQGAAQRLQAAVAAVLALTRPPDAVLVTGDLADDGDPRTYARVRELLAPLPMPVHPIPGNHDDRDALREAWEDHPGVAGTVGGPIVYAERAGALRLALLDTLVPRSDAGRLGRQQLAWLAAVLDEEPATPALVALHHPPILTGVEGFDVIGLPPEDRAGLAEVLATRPQARAVVAGHVHRVVAGACGGVPVLTAPSAWRQAVLDLTPGADAVTGDDPPGFAVHVLTDDGALASHAAVV